MKMKITRAAIFSAVIFLTGCSLLQPSKDDATDLWPLSSTHPYTSFSIVSLRVTAPESTANNAELGLMLFDEVTGNPYNSHTIKLEPLGDAVWGTEITLPALTVLRYRYVRLSPSHAEETTALRQPVEFRLAFFPGGNEINDRIAGWTDEGFEGQTGRIVGRVLDSTSGLPVTEALVAAAGELTFTDRLGSFQFDRIPPGLHNLVVLSLDGSYQPAQQGAIVAENSLTPAEMSLTPAAKTPVTFEVTLPENTPLDIPIRLAGNILPFGQRFYRLEGDVSTSSASMPALIRVDDTHAIFIADLYEGTDLHYKYTLGDGLWNAERDSSGYFRLRQTVITPDLILRDTVDSWYGEQQGAVYFITSIPENTSPTATVTLQLNPFSWFDPLPMTRLNNNQWVFTLFSPLDFSYPVTYRYCLNYICSNPGSPAAVLQSGTYDFLPQNTSQLLEDQVESWGWPEPEHAEPVALPEMSPRPSFETGLEILPGGHPDWPGLVQTFAVTASDINPDSIIFAPSWTAGSEPAPLLQFDPENSPFYTEMALGVQAASGQGLNPVIKPVLFHDNLEQWWLESPRDWSWWNLWFERYQAMILTYAHLAEETGAHRLIIGGGAVTPALPGGTLADGSDSQAPVDAEARWSKVIEAVRSTYSGDLGFETVYAPDMILPSFLDSVDTIVIRLEAPLADAPDEAPAVLQQNALSSVADVVNQAEVFSDQLLIISFSFPSIDGGATGCIPGEQLTCIPVRDFNHGSNPGGPDVDLSEQMEAIHAVMLAVYRFEQVDGIYINRINPASSLPDKSSSILGKPAQDLVATWFSRIR